MKSLNQYNKNGINVPDTLHLKNGSDNHPAFDCLYCRRFAFLPENGSSKSLANKHYAFQQVVVDKYVYGSMPVLDEEWDEFQKR